MSQSPVRILGIDPGYDRLGVAIVEKTVEGKEILVHSSCFETEPVSEIYSRLTAIGEEISRIIAAYKPHTLAIETLFITKNQKTAMRVAEARGIIIYEAVRHGIPVHEYGPMQIKSAISGDGTADKARMIKMIGLLIDVPPKKRMLDDEYDAIAVALTHGALIHTRTRLPT